MSTDREKRLRKELDEERTRNRHLLMLNGTLAAGLSERNIELYELKYGKKYPRRWTT